MKIKFLKNNEFGKNVLTLMTGTVLAQALPIAISPILTRIYTPEDFGLLGLFVALVSVFGSLSCGRYELAIMLPKKDSEALNLLALSLLICTILSVILLLVVVVFDRSIAKLLGNEDIAIWLYLVPLSVFLTGLYNVLNYYSIRRKYYKDIRSTVIVKSFLSAAIQLSFGLLKNGATGLISAQIISQSIANRKLFTNMRKHNTYQDLNKIKMFALAKKYKDFPKFTLWAGLANALAKNMNNILISTFYSITTLGFYGFSERILGTPASLIGSSVGQVFFQQASKEQQETGTAYYSFIKTTKILILIGLPFYFALYFTVENLFFYVFGKEWLIAGTYSKILIPLFFIRFVVSPLTVVNQINKKNKIGMYWQFGLLFLYAIIISISHFFNVGFVEFLHYLVFFVTLYYMFFYFLIYRHVKEGKVE